MNLVWYYIVVISYDDDNPEDYTYQDFVNELDIIMCRVNPGANKMWHATGSNIGWQHRNGKKIFTANRPREFLDKILPTSAASIKLTAVGKQIAMTVYHHDAPTGEQYKIVPIECSTKIG